MENASQSKEHVAIALVSYANGFCIDDDEGVVLSKAHLMLVAHGMTAHELWYPVPHEKQDTQIDARTDVDRPWSTSPILL